MQNKKAFSHTIIYDRFVENPKDQILQLLEVLRLPKEHMELGYTAMNSYSQAGVGLPSGKLAKDDKLEKLRKMSKKLFNIYGLKFDVSRILPSNLVTVYEVDEHGFSYREGGRSRRLNFENVRVFGDASELPIGSYRVMLVQVQTLWFAD